MAKSKKNSKKKGDKNVNISMTPLLYIGVVVVFGTALIQSFFPNFPTMARNILYFFGIMAFVIYMFQIAFEKRTGKSEDGAESKENRLSNRK